MKYLYKMLLVAYCTLALTACSNQALTFNNKVVDLQKEVEVKVTELSAKMEGADSVKVRQLLPELKQMVAFIDAKTNTLKTLKGPDDGTAFKKSMVQQFEFLKKLYQQNISYFEDNLSEQEKTKLGFDIQNMVPEAKLLEQETIKEQQLFAKKNGITLQ